MIILKIAVVAVIAAVASMLLKQYGKEEYSIIAVIAASVIILLILVPSFTKIKECIDCLTELAGNCAEYALILVKSLAVAVITQVAADLCEDSGNKSLADKVELGGKTVIVVLCLPMIKAVAEFSVNLIGG